MIIIAVACYVVINFKKMLWLESNTNSTVRDLVEKNDAVYKYSELNLVVFYVAKKQLARGMLWLDMPDLDKYLDIYFEQETWNWYKPIDDGRVVKKRIEARQCNRFDFGFYANADRDYATWDGFSLICPDIKPGEDVYL